MKKLGPHLCSHCGRVSIVCKRRGSHGCIEVIKEERMKYPRLPRKHDARYKLSEEQVEKIVSLNKRGFKVKQLAILFKVSTSTIYYWITKRRGFPYKRKLYKSPSNPAATKATERKKLQIQGIALRLYHSEKARLYKKEHKND